MSIGFVEAIQRHLTGIHAPDCAFGRMNGKPIPSCGGTYVCPRCERGFGWCTGAADDTPALCDDCAVEIQFPE